MPRPKRLLFVDDEEGIRITLPLVLKERGFEVQVAATVPEAVGKLRIQPFDVLISDLNIHEPDDGFVVIEAARKVNPDCVSVILTGYPALESAVKGIRAAVDNYLVKPADIDELLATIEGALAKRKE